MRLNTLCAVAGTWWLQQKAGLPQLGMDWMRVAAAAAGALPATDGTLARGMREVLVKLACAGAGFGWAALLAHALLSDSLPPHWEARDIELVGIVSSLPQATERNVRFEFDVERVTTPEAVVPRHIVLSWWGGA